MTIPNDSEHAGQVVPAAPAPRALTAAEFHQLADVPPAMTWFANIDNEQTRRAYQHDVQEFMAFAGIEDPHAFRLVGRGHVLAWRRDLERRALSAASIRRKLSALSSLFESLCEANAVQGNPVDGVKRPKLDSQEGKTPAIGDRQARELLAAPDASTLQGLRDRAILATLLYHGLRRAELCALRLVDVQDRRGVRHLQVHGKGSKIRYVPLHPAAAGAIAAYLEAAGHGDDKPGPHALRATAATNALEHDADIAKVQQWLGHANISTTRVYDRRQMRGEDSPTFRVVY